MTDLERSYMDWFKVYHEEIHDRVSHWGDVGIGKKWAFDEEEENSYGN